MYDEAETDEWTQPSEAEMKILQSKQERSDEISRRLGNYMLQGYRMLDALCDVCGTIMMQPRNGEDFCVACTEMESEISKDDHAISEEAALSTKREQEERKKANASGEGRITSAFSKAIDSSIKDAVRSTAPNRSFPQSSFGASSVPHAMEHSKGEIVEDSLAPVKQTMAAFNKPNEDSGFQNPQPDIRVTVPCTHLNATIHELLKKIAEYTEALKVTDNIETTGKLADVIKSCSDSVYAVKRIL